MMRQAGRTLQEYRAIREKYSFREVMENPELAAEVTLQPLKRFPVDAAIIFCDILVIPEVFGMDVQYSPKLQISPPSAILPMPLILKLFRQVKNYAMSPIPLASLKMKWATKKPSSVSPAPPIHSHAT